MFKTILLTAIGLCIAYSVVIVAFCTLVGANYTLRSEEECSDEEKM